MIRGERRLISERMGTVPSSMKLSQEESNRLWDSFGNIFKSIGSSAKLLYQNLLFNAKVVIASMDGDRRNVNKAFEDYAAARKQFAEEADENLKYYREAMYTKSTDSQGRPVTSIKTGPALFLAMTNPIALAGAAWKPGRGFDDTADAGDAGLRPDGSPEPVPGPAKGATSVAASDRLARAMGFFGYGNSSAMSEAARAPKAAKPADSNPARQQEELSKLQTLASDYVSSEKERGDKLLNMFLGRIQFFKKFVEASTFEELNSAASFAQSQGIKFNVDGIERERQKISKQIDEMSVKNPEDFKSFIGNMRAQYSDLDKKDDKKAILQLAFRTSKSQVQDALMKEYSLLIEDIKKTMNLPLDPQTSTEMQKTQIGQEYLNFLTSFEAQLEKGERELQAV